MLIDSQTHKEAAEEEKVAKREAKRECERDKQTQVESSEKVTKITRLSAKIAAFRAISIKVNARKN